MRPTLGVIGAALGAAFAAFVVSEYEFVGTTPWAAALAIGVLVGELVAGGGRWHGRSAMVVSAAIAGGALMWGEWLESDSGRLRGRRRRGRRRRLDDARHIYASYDVWFLIEHPSVVTT